METGPQSDASAEPEPEASSGSEATSAVQGELLEEPTAQAGTATTASPSEPEIIAGPAPAGVTYFLSSEEIGEDDKVQLYKDGKPFSRVGEDGLEKHPTYDSHPEPAFPPEFTAYIDAVENASTFDEVKKAMATFYTSQVFKAMTPEQQNKIRANTWDTMLERKLKVPDHATDVSAFRLWIEAQEDVDAITGTLGVLEEAPGFASKEDAFKDGIRRAADRRREMLRK